MAKEQERKYLINIPKLLGMVENGFPHDEKLVSKELIKQAYLGDSGVWEAFVTLSTPNRLLLVSRALNRDYALSLKSEDAIQLIEHPTSSMQGDGSCKISLEHWALRVRIFENGSGEVTLKERIAGEIRGECNAPADPMTAQALFDSVANRISKMRYNIEKAGYIWDVDVFNDLNRGLGVAELETSDRDYPLLSIIESEVTKDPRYYNDNLSYHPFTKW